MILNEVKNLVEEIEQLKKQNELMDQLIVNINSLEKSFNLFREKRNECTKDSKSEDELIRQKHQCDFCDYVGKSKSGLKNHMRAKHNSRKNPTVENQESETKETVSSALESYCPECDVIYKCEEVLIFREHCKAQHGWLWCTNWNKGDGCEFATTSDDELKMHVKTCQDNQT